VDDHNGQIDPEFAGLPLKELADAALDLDLAMLEKPFVPATLACRVHEALEHARSRALANQ